MIQEFLHKFDIDIYYAFYYSFNLNLNNMTDKFIKLTLIQYRAVRF